MSDSLDAFGFELAAMPDLCTPTRGAAHTLDSAILTLSRLGLEMDRIVVEAGGGGYPDGRVLTQVPAPGEPLPLNGRVHLVVAGFGGVETLPYPMRDEDPREFRADRLFALFDNPVLKLRHHLRLGGGYLDLHPDNRAAQRRWLEDVFQFDLDPWPPRFWFSLVRLHATLHREAGRPSALGVAYRLLFNLEPVRVQLRQGVLPFRDDQRTRLGTRATTLGADTVIGSGLEAPVSAKVTIGPVTLDTYLAQQTPEMIRLRRLARRLTLPAHLWAHATEQWTVGEGSEGSLLGDPAAPTMLGVNARLVGSPPSAESTHLGVALHSAGSPRPDASPPSTKPPQPIVTDRSRSSS